MVDSKNIEYIKRKRLNMYYLINGLGRAPRKLSTISYKVAPPRKVPASKRLKLGSCETLILPKGLKS